ncbi:MAG: flavin monoamine oxidase family protein [Alphaproteobacteria bacterium]
MTIDIDRRLVLGGLAALSACRSPRKELDAEVIIIGAGLSGLHAARLLVSEGKDVLVLEGSYRIGGRLHTLDHGKSGFTEGGGEQVGANYARIIDTARNLGVPLRPDTRRPQPSSYYYKDKLLGPDDWKNLDGHPFAPPFNGATPAAPLFALAARENPLTSPMDWRDKSFKAHDISANAFLKSKGFDDEARRVMEIALNGNNLDSYSMMNLYRTVQTFTQARSMGPSLSIKNGAQRLPEAMANSLPRNVKTGQMIAAIEASTDVVTITTKDGKTYRAPHCICTLPFAALRSVKISAPFASQQYYAIKNLPYTQIYQVHFRANSPFWEKDGLPTDMWTDSPIERIFTQYDENNKPTGLFRAWINGDQASTWAASHDPKAKFISEFKKIRPASEGDVAILSLQNWTKSNALAGGAYMHWAPKQIPLMAENMSKPAGRLSFAGEHLSYLQTGMEGAMESAENAAFSLMDF